MPTLYHENDQPIPGHTLLQFLGEGGFGEVWKTLNPHKIEVALKIVQIHGKQGLREVLAIRLLRNVRHPNLIPIFGFWLKDQEGNILEHSASDTLSGFSLDGEYQFFLAMGLGDKSLSDRLKECVKEGSSGIPLDELMQYMEESARALDFLNTPTHNMGGKERSSIEHCDIKPQNLMLVGGSVQICDFGLARVLQHGVKQQHSASFSHHYVAPELLKRDLGPTRGTDQYSLAVSYYQLRTGQLPFGDVSFAPAILTAHLEGNLDFSLVPQREQVVLRRATMLKPDQRFPSCRAFVEALREAFGAMTKPPRLSPAGLKGPLRPGLEIVPGYKLEELIGRGSFGEVWRASAPGRMKKALKIIRNLDLASSRQEMRSLELITEVRHPHLLCIESYYLLDAQGDLIPDELRDEADAPKADTLVIVSELAESHLGARLQQCYRQTGNGIASAELLPYMQQVAGALDRLNNQHDIIHRDVKPENILLVSGIAKLADFGLAKALEGSSALVHTKSIGMTPAYAAPELCNSRIEENTDQYSLALTYYHLRTGHLATGNASDLSELIMAHLSNKLNFGEVPPAEEKVLKRAAALESQQRYPNCTAFVQALGATFSRSQMPSDWQDEPFAEPLSLGIKQRPNKLSDPNTSIEWEKDTNQEYRALAVELQEAETSTDTVKKLTDTARESAKQSQKAQKKPVPTPQPVTLKPKRAQHRRSVGKRLAASLVLLVILGSAITGFIVLIARKDNKRDEAVTGSNTVPQSAPIPTRDQTPPLSTKPVETKPVVVVEDEDLVQQASNLMTQGKAIEAFEPLRQLAERLTIDSSAKLRQQTLALATTCFQKLPSVESGKKMAIVEKYRPLATDHIEHLRDDLRQDRLFQPSQKQQWSTDLGIAELADPNNPWVCALFIEQCIHDGQAKTDSMFKALQTLEAQTDSQLGSYRQYLIGAGCWRLGQPEKAAQAYDSLSPTQHEIRWDNRRDEITTVLQVALDEQKKQLLKLPWQGILTADRSLQETKKYLTSLSDWKNGGVTPEENAVLFLTASIGKANSGEAKKALDLARKNPIDVNTLSASLRLAYLSRYSALLIQANESESADEVLLIGHLFIESLEKEEPKPSAQARFVQLQPLVAWSKQLATPTNLAIKSRQKLAQLLFWHGQLLIENPFETWHGEQRPTAVARDEFKTAISLMSDLDNALRSTIKVWKAFADHELNYPDWEQELDSKKIDSAALEKSAKPMVLFLQGEKQLADGRKAKTLESRLRSVDQARASFGLTVKTYQDDPNSNWYLLNLSRIGQSNAHLEYANYLHTEEGLLKDERTSLAQAENSARAVLQDSRAKPLEAKAQIALGNALEDFGLLLKDNHDREAITCFATAVQLSQGKPQASRALVNLGRIMIRSGDESKWPQAETKLKDALTLVKERDVASEAYFWLAYLFEKRKDFDAAETALKQAENQADTQYFKDVARCEAFDLLLKKPLIKPFESTVTGRISLIDRNLPKPDTIDPQVRKKAEWLRVKGLNELGNLYFLAARVGPEGEKSRHLTTVNEKAELLLRDKPTELAELYAGRLHAKVFLAQNQVRKAFEATEASGNVESLITQWQANKKLTDPFLEAAILDIADTRFDIFFKETPNREKDFLKQQAPKSIKWCDQLVPLLDKKNDYYFMIKGHAGLLRSWVLFNVRTNEEFNSLFKQSDRRTFDEVAQKHLREVLDEMPQNKYAWRWAFGLYILSNISNDNVTAKKYLEQTIKLAKQPASEVDNTDLEKLERTLESLK
jgi:serine/threonine protein kinase